MPYLVASMSPKNKGFNSPKNKKQNNATLPEFKKINDMSEIFSAFT